MLPIPFRRRLLEYSPLMRLLALMPAAIGPQRLPALKDHLPQIRTILAPGGNDLDPMLLGMACQHMAESLQLVRPKPKPRRLPAAVQLPLGRGLDDDMRMRPVAMVGMDREDVAVPPSPEGLREAGANGRAELLRGDNAAGG